MQSIPDLLSIAVQHHQAGRLDAAAQGYRQVLSLDAQQVAAWVNLGAALHEQRQLEDAAHCYRQAIALAPNVAEAHGNLGTVLKEQGKADEALASYRRAIEVDPGYAVGHSDLGVLLQEQGRIEEAIACYRRAIELSPTAPRPWFNLGTALRDAGDSTAAVDCYQRALALDPTYVTAHCNLGNALKDLGRLDEALACYHRALQIAPQFADAYNNMAAVLQQQGRLKEAIAWYQGALAVGGEVAQVYSNLGTACRELGKIEDAIAAHRRAIELQPDYAEAFNHLGTALQQAGDVDAGIECYRHAIALRPDLISIHSNLLFALQFSQRYDAAAIYNEHRNYDEVHCRPLAQSIQPHANDRNPSRRLRVGYVSPDFRDHCQAFFTVPLLSNHNHEQFDVYCYSDVPSPDKITDRLRGYADVWRNIVGLSTQQVSQLVRDDQIDILVDLTMHMNRTHLLIFARKPAPIQVCWLAYPGTTGLSAIDYRLTDPQLDPPGLFDAYYSEQPIRLPNTFWCYDPLTSELAVNELPALTNGYVTFGSLNNFCKTNETVFRLWARVLKAVDRSRFILLADEGSHRQRTLDFFQREGVAPDRISIVSKQPRVKYLAVYHQIDIGLDTFPYNGHTTSLDAYWMGVPVVTLVGKTVVGRAGLSQLTNLGLTEFIAGTPDKYVEIATTLAADLPRLRELRHTLRDRMQSSTLMDCRGFAQNIESAYRAMWNRWCARETDEDKE